jgi:hypothetical protein
MSKKLLSVGIVMVLIAAVFVGVGAIDASASYTFTRNLTIGSTGADVTALQNFLISNGNTIPAGATGYFGAQTRDALVAYQAAKGITPAAGYFGPITMASINANTVVVTPTVAGCPAGAAFNSLTGAPCGVVSTVPGCTAGALFSSTTGASCTTGGTTSGAGITTPGAEGTITVSASNAGLNSSVYEGDTAKVLGIKVEAKSSDILVQRVKVGLGNSTAIYNRVLDAIHIMDGSTVLASKDLNSSTVVLESGTYYVYITGLDVLVLKDTSKILTVAVDVKGVVDSTYRPTTRTISVPASGVRGIDGAGIDQVSGGSVSRTFSVSTDLVESASLKTSISASSPAATTVIASSGSLQNEADKVTTLVFRVKAERDDVLVNDITVSATTSAATADLVTTAYLYDGSTELDNSAISNTTGLATFSNLDLLINKDSTKTLTIKLDIRNASSTAVTVITSVDGTLIDAENSMGDTVTSVTGSATGESMRVQKAGAVFTLVGTPTLVKSPIGNTASSTFLTSFTFDVSAEGEDVEVATTSAFVVGIYVNNVQVATSSLVYAKPTSGITQSGTGPYNIADGSKARFVAEYGFVAPNGVYTPAGAIVNARVESATTDAGTVTYISDTFRTGSSTL